MNTKGTVLTLLLVLTSVLPPAPCCFCVHPKSTQHFGGNQKCAQLYSALTRSGPFSDFLGKVGEAVNPAELSIPSGNKTALWISPFLHPVSVSSVPVTMPRSVSQTLLPNQICSSHAPSPLFPWLGKQKILHIFHLLPRQQRILMTNRLLSFTIFSPSYMHSVLSKVQER